MPVKLAAVERVDYTDTFIAVAEDCPATAGTAPAVNPDKPSVAARTYELIAEHPYEFTSGDLIFTVHADRRGIPEHERAAARAEFYATGQPLGELRGHAEWRAGGIQQHSPPIWRGLNMGSSRTELQSLSLGSVQVVDGQVEMYLFRSRPAGQVGAW